MLVPVYFSSSCILVLNLLQLVSRARSLVDIPHAEPSFYRVYANSAGLADSIPLCDSWNSVCNVVHDRVWFKPLVVHFCKCPDNPCPVNWDTDARNKNSQYLNPRAQLKLCGNGNSQELATCKSNEQAVWKTVLQEGTTTKTKVQLSCHCPHPSANFQVKTSTTRPNNSTVIKQHWYSCAPLTNCKSEEFCGFITKEMFQTYFICRCPEDHACMMRNKRVKRIKELLYVGDAYSGICMPMTK